MKFALKLAVAAILLGVIFSQFNVRLVGKALLSAQVFYCCLAYAGMAVVACLAALQLSMGFTGQGLDLSFLTALRIQLVTAFYALIIPTGFGASVVKWYKLSRNRAGFTEAAALLVYVRVVNMVSLLALGLPAVLLEGRISGMPFRLAFGVAFGASLVAMTPFWCPPIFSRLTTLLRWLLKSTWLPEAFASRVAKTWRAFEALSQLNKAYSVGILVSGLSSHLIGVLAFYLLCRALAIDLGILPLVWLRLVLHLLQLVPVSIAGLGVREATLVNLLPTLYDVPSETALALSFLLMGRHLFLGFLGGVFEGAYVFLGSKRSGAGE